MIRNEFCDACKPYAEYVRNTTQESNNNSIDSSKNELLRKFQAEKKFLIEDKSKQISLIENSFNTYKDYTNKALDKIHAELSASKLNYDKQKRECDELKNKSDETNFKYKKQLETIYFSHSLEIKHIQENNEKLKRDIAVLHNEHGKKEMDIHHYRKELEKIQASHKLEIENVSKDNLAKVNEEYKKELEKIQASHKLEIENVSKDNLAKVNEKYKKELEKIQASQINIRHNYKTELDLMQAYHKLEIQYVLKDKLIEANEKHKRELELMQASHKLEIQDVLKDKLAEANEEHEKELEKIQTSHKLEIENVSKDNLAKVNEEYEKELEKIQASHKLEIENVSNDKYAEANDYYKKELKKIQAFLDLQIEKIQASDNKNSIKIRNLEHQLVLKNIEISDLETKQIVSENKLLFAESLLRAGINNNLSLESKNTTTVITTPSNVEDTNATTNDNLSLESKNTTTNDNLSLESKNTTTVITTRSNVEDTNAKKKRKYSTRINSSTENIIPLNIVNYTNTYNGCVCMSTQEAYDCIKSTKAHKIIHDQTDNFILQPIVDARYKISYDVVRKTKPMKCVICEELLSKEDGYYQGTYMTSCDEHVCHAKCVASYMILCENSFCLCKSI
jgi:hypothetical protein